MSFPEWMGPNIEDRHVKDMGWGLDLPPALPDGPPPPLAGEPAESLPYRCNRHTVVCASGREYAIYAPTLDDARSRAGQELPKTETIVDVFVYSGRTWVSEPRDAKVLVDNPPSFKRK